MTSHTSQINTQTDSSTSTYQRKIIENDLTAGSLNSATQTIAVHSIHHSTIIKMLSIKVVEFNEKGSILLHIVSSIQFVSNSKNKSV